MKVYAKKYGEVDLADSPISRGGEGAVYTLRRKLPSIDAIVCAKIYFADKRNDERHRKTKYMAEHTLAVPRTSHYTIAWPLDVLYDTADNFLGFLMYKAADGSERLSVLVTPNLTLKGVGSKLWHSYYDRKDDGVHILHRLTIMVNICEAICQIHNAGQYVLKDFKPDNVLSTCDGNVTIVDVDSIQICDSAGKLLFPAPVATREYIPPECGREGIGKQRTAAIGTSWDIFAIGIVFYKLLLGLHPYVCTPRLPNGDDSCDTLQDKINAGYFPFGTRYADIAFYPPLHEKFRYLPQQVQVLFKRTFVEQASTRPSINEWFTVLKSVLYGVSGSIGKRAANYCYLCGHQFSTNTECYCPTCGSKRVSLS